MAILPRNRPRILTGALVLALALSFGGSCAAAQPTERFLDAVLASVNGRIVAASDVAIARALSLFGAKPSDAPIQQADAERLVDGRLIDQESVQLEIGGTPQEFEDAWRAAADRVGGTAALEAWMDQNELDTAWLKKMVEADLRWRRFIDLRFRAFVFISDSDVSQALGPGPHSAETREATREKLQAEAVNRDMASWLAEARKRATIRRAELEKGGVLLPFPMPHARP